MSYRPKGWVNPHADKLLLPRVSQNAYSRSNYSRRLRDFEAGATAYEDTLKAEGLRINLPNKALDANDIFDWLLAARRGQIKGTLVFIPEEEVKP